MFRRLLIANRGEVAARVSRTARRMGIETVALASAADREAQWLSEVDHVVAIGGARASESYLDQDAVIEAARRTGAAALHPGWGFLSENDVFAQRVIDAGIAWVGPTPESIRRMGDKALARQTMQGFGLDPIPGSEESVGRVDEARRVAEEVGYPVLLKAVAGGGGRGMRGVDTPDALAEAFEAASAEAIASFGDGRIYLERRITAGRHVEVQILADGWGNVIHLGERECSLQRRHQKVMEEARAPGLDDAERDRILPRVVEAVCQAGYRGAGTVEMLVDEQGTAWFMEMNTRLQVEHPVTECLTGLDLVEEMLHIAANAPLRHTQADIAFDGHAIECRLNAEDPGQGFRPSPGVVTRLALPEGEGLRVDTHLREGDRIPPHYDSMVAKIIAHGPDRATALARMRAALDATVVEGVRTNRALHRWLLDRPEVIAGAYNTTSLERWLAEDTTEDAAWRG